MKRLRNGGVKEYYDRIRALRQDADSSFMPFTVKYLDKILDQLEKKYPEELRGERVIRKNPVVKHINDPDHLLDNIEYRYFVVADGRIVSGWEYQDDAKDDARDNKSFYGGSVKVYARRAVTGRGTNPVPEGKRSKIMKATKKYEAFRDQDSKHIREYNINPNNYKNSSTNHLGFMRAIEYTAVRAGKTERYRHDFKPYARPAVYTIGKRKDANMIRTIYGRFEFTERGFVDKTHKSPLNTKKPDYSVLCEVGTLDAFEFETLDGKRSFRSKIPARERPILAVTAAGDAIYTLKK